MLGWRTLAANTLQMLFYLLEKYGFEKDFLLFKNVTRILQT